MMSLDLSAFLDETGQFQGSGSDIETKSASNGAGGAIPAGQSG